MERHVKGRIEVMPMAIDQCLTTVCQTRLAAIFEPPPIRWCGSADSWTAADYE